MIFVSLRHNGILVPVPEPGGTVSNFGGPGDPWLDGDERDWADRFLVRDLGTDRVANADTYYGAMRWEVDGPAFTGESVDTVKAWYNAQRVILTYEDRAAVLWIADKGPGIEHRAIDLGRAPMNWLGVETDKQRVQIGWGLPAMEPGPYVVKNGRLVPAKID